MFVHLFKFLSLIFRFHAYNFFLAFCSSKCYEVNDANTFLLISLEL